MTADDVGRADERLIRHRCEICIYILPAYEDDDVCPRPGFRERLPEGCTEIPDEWDVSDDGSVRCSVASTFIAPGGTCSAIGQP